MQMNEYQYEATKTAIYNGRGETTGLMYASLGLVGEAGEIANKVKKMWRDGYDRNSQGELKAKYDEARANIKGELGDVLWYIANVAQELGIDLEDVAIYNNRKLASRQERGVLGGSGDNR